MTRATNARIAGFTFFFYIAAALPGALLFDRATRGNEIAAKLASIAPHASDIRVAIVLSLLGCLSALVLAVTLYGVTRDEDHELAMLALAGRFGEGVLGAIPILAMVGLLWLGTAAPFASDSAAANALGAFLLKAQVWGTIVGATFFAGGSTLFSWLLMRGRMVPISIAWLGVVASVVLVAGLPLQLAGFISGRVTLLMWLPMTVFELTLAAWLLIKGVAARGA